MMDKMEEPTATASVQEGNPQLLESFIEKFLHEQQHGKESDLGSTTAHGGELNEDDQRDHRSDTPSTNTEEANEPDAAAEMAEENGQRAEETNTAPLTMSSDAAAEMTRQLQFVGHQLVKLICGLGQAPCMCAACAKQFPKNMPSTSCLAANNKTAKRAAAEAAASRAGSTPNTPFSASNDFDISMMSQMVKQMSNGALGVGGVVEINEDGSLKRGRKSKYCSGETKRQVADYAELHGATAAARKFDIPASVAAYYHRKLKKSLNAGGGASSTGTILMRRMLAQQQQQLSSQAPPTMATSVPPMSDLMLKSHAADQSVGDVVMDEAENQRSFGSYLNNNTGMSNSTVGTPTALTTPSSLLLNKDDTSSSLMRRSPSRQFLRGRGRGRPKLIGDELDAELVDYMVDVKSKLPRAHLTASQALELARAYILEKAPQILEENGGHINLKITWAMKLVARTNERWRELYGGRGVSSGGGGVMSSAASATMDAQDQSSVQINDQLTEFLAQLTQNQNGTSTNGSMPEITNIRELQFPFTNDEDEDADEYREEEGGAEDAENQEEDDEANDDAAFMVKSTDFASNGGGEIMAE